MDGCLIGLLSLIAIPFAQAAAPAKVIASGDVSDDRTPRIARYGFGSRSRMGINKSTPRVAGGYKIDACRQQGQNGHGTGYNRYIAADKVHFLFGVVSSVSAWR
jgi:hypothetical protein